MTIGASGYVSAGDGPTATTGTITVNGGLTNNGEIDVYSGSTVDVTDKYVQGTGAMLDLYRGTFLTRSPLTSRAEALGATAR